MWKDEQTDLILLPSFSAVKLPTWWQPPELHSHNDSGDSSRGNELTNSEMTEFLHATGLPGSDLAEYSNTGGMCGVTAVVWIYDLSGS